MPLISTRQLAHTPVKYGRQTIGRTNRVWFDLDTGQGLGVIVTQAKNQRLLYRQDARLSDDSLAVANRDLLLKLEKPSRAEQVSRLNRHLIGAAVETEDGRRVGILKDFLITDLDWRIHQLIVQDKSGERLINHEVIVALADDLVTVRSDVLDALIPLWMAGTKLELLH